MEQKQQMDAQRLAQSLGLTVALSLMLLIVGAIGLSVTIRQRDHIPPNLDVSISGLHIAAYTTDPIGCQPNLRCPGSTREYQVFWVVHKTAPDSVHETWHRILSVPLRR